MPGSVRMVSEWLCLCAGATAVALEPRANAQRAEKARASPKASLVMEEAAFFVKKKTSIL